MDPKEVAALFFCIETLQDRAEKDAEDAWMWRLKEKVAWSHVALRERELGIGEGDCPLYSTCKLSNGDREEVLRAHPLLKMTFAAEVNEEPDPSTGLPYGARSMSMPEATRRGTGRGVESKELSELFFCVETLRRLAGEDPASAWLWRLKEKIAWFHVAQCEKGLRSEDDDVPIYSTYELSNSERDEVVRNHPLLEKPSARELEKAHSRHDDWFDEIRSKVKRYLRK